MNSRYIHTYFIAFLSLVLIASVFTACNPDEIDAPGYVPEGEPATMSLKVNLDEISIKTRANMNSDLENRVECLWVAIYNARTGERTFSKFYAPNGDFPEIEKKFGTIDDIETESGNSYIVAVANYQNKTAVDLTGNDGAAKDTELGLETLLAAADTWDKYRAIAIKQKSDGDYASIETPMEAIVMQGCYRASGHAENYTEDEGAETVGIQPGANNLDGIIHLRRIWTQNTFNIVPDGDVISMELVNVEVVNVPMLTWLYGRPQDNDGGTLGYANAGDAYSPVVPDDLEHPMYKKSLTYTPTSMTVKTDDKGRPNYTFDYWQYENKRNSETATTYADREVEHKNADGTNSGIYTALCGTGGKATLDNNATFLRFTARIRYIVNDIQSPGEIADDIGKVKYRNAEATYVVHLGYIGDDAKDFNCYRNSRYTYNIKVMSVDKILLEAFRKSESQPGAEGAVTDVTDEFFDLDAHFNVFNIYLTKDQLANFTFSMTTYEDNVPHTITNITDEKLSVTANVPKKGDTNWKYYSWIQLVENGKTDKKTEIAKFPNLTNGETDKVLYLDDISKKADELGKDEGYCFTVYVKEYTYEADYGETGYGNESGTEWTHYVNQPSRIANFNVAYSVSNDRESQHFKAKYALSQRSIQTYYDIAAATSGSGTALGVEHIDEVFGMNIRWTKDDPSGGYDANNGRYNVWRVLGGTDGGTTAGSWTKTDVLNTESLLEVNPISNTAQTEHATHLNTDGGIRYVPAMQPFSGSLSGTDGYYDSFASDYDPQDRNTAVPQYIQGIYSCMNRNKDENGNGIIDAAELKWYVPTSGKYLRVILGRNSLVTPLMGYEQETLPEASATGHNTLYHFISSDRKIIWADEGMSSSEFNTNSMWQIAPWQVRCVRNLGTILGTVTKGEKVKQAYEDTDVDSNTKGGVVKPVRYYGTSLRNPTTLPLPPHKTSSPYNRLARYGFEIAPAGNGNTANYTREAGLYAITYNATGTTALNAPRIGSHRAYDSNTKKYYYADYTEIKDAIETASPCEKLNKSSGRKGWRVPNQKEIVIMMRAGVINTGYIGFYDYTVSNGSVTASNSGSWFTGAPGMMCCTQEHWPSIGGDENTVAGSVSGLDALSGSHRWTTIEPTSKLATAKKHSNIRAVRCVRDLTAAEANMSYTQIKNHKTN